MASRFSSSFVCPCVRRSVTLRFARAACRAGCGWGAGELGAGRGVGGGARCSHIPTPTTTLFFPVAQERKKGRLALASSRAQTRAMASWQWADEYGVWSPYDPKVNATLEEAFASRHTSVVGIALGHGGGHKPTHRVELDPMEQVNERTGFRRPVRREISTSSSGSVSFHDERGRWIKYEQGPASQVCTAALAGRAGTTIYVRHSNTLWAYWVDVKGMKQTNRLTNMVRPIRFDQPNGKSSSGGAGGGVGGPPAGVVGCALSSIGSALGSALGSAMSATGGSGSAFSASSAAASDGLPPPPWKIKFTATSASALDVQALTRWTVLKPGEWADGATDPVMLSDLGDDGEIVVRLPCHTDACSCTFNVSTVQSAFRSSNRCPTCGTLYGMPGPQPTGTMRVELDPAADCDGHPGVGSLILTYDFWSGTQQPQHPEPGQPYRGTNRTCYLPNDATGHRCLRLLRAAFLQGELFRVGKSATTGRDNTVVWAIHQKTSPHGGPTRHGWPDDDYAQRLQSECAAANVQGALEIS